MTKFNINPGNEISKRIIEKMQEKDLSIYKVAKRAGIFPGTVDNHLRNPNSFKSVVNFFNIAKAIGVDINYLFYGNDFEEVENEAVRELEKKIEELREELKSKLEKLSAIKNILKDV